MSIKRVLLVEKRHAYEALKDEAKMRDENRAQLKESYDMHIDSLEKVKSAIVELGLEITSIIKGEEQVTECKNFDIVVSVGGDGTFIAATHAINDETPILGVKSDVIRSRGIFCSATADTVKEKLTKLLKNQAQLRKVSRIKVRLEGKELPIRALNEILVTSHDNVITARYGLKIDDEFVYHLDSGLLICTGSGSTGWMNSAQRVRLDQIQRVAQALGKEPTDEELADLSKKVNSNLSFPADDSRMRFLSREGIVSSISSSKLQSGYSEKFEVRSRMQDGLLVIDSKYRYTFLYGDIAELEVDAIPLTIVD